MLKQANVILMKMQNSLRDCQRKVDDFHLDIQDVLVDYQFIVDNHKKDKPITVFKDKNGKKYPLPNMSDNGKNYHYTITLCVKHGFCC